jgi:hypothetical protein
LSGFEVDRIRRVDLIAKAEGRDGDFADVLIVLAEMPEADGEKA